MSSIGPILRSLVEANARFVVVGGLAVVVRGYARLTADVDLVVDLGPGEAIKVVAALERVGLVPRAPVSAREFADAQARRRWIDEKGMLVFSMHDPRRPLVEVDLFVDPPIPFDELAARATWHDLFGQRVLVAGLADLLTMKRIAGRPKDLEDVRALEAIAKGRPS